MAEELRQVGRYRIRRVIGRGSMGVVYEGHDPALGRTVAIKTIDLAFKATEEQRKQFIQRFLAEARAAAGLQHPAIVVVYDIGRDEQGVLYMALEHLAGETLERVLARGAIPWLQAVELAARLAEGLHHAHQAGIVHRDVKPSNVMVMPSGEPKILDFGVAKLTAAERTATGQGFGSPAYMSPEQAEGRSVDARSDIFSLGSVLYEMLTGQRAFDGKSLPAILSRVAGAQPTPLRDLRPDVPLPIEEAVSQALQKDPEQRPADAASFAEALRDAIDASGAVGSPRHPRTRTAVTRFGGVIGDRTRQSGSDGLALPAGKRVSLAIVGGPGSGKVLPMEKPRVTLGRDGLGASADLLLPDPEISRVHALLQCDGERFELQDLGSTNGTFLDDQRIETTQIADASEFRLGATTLLLIVSDPE